MQRLFEPNVPFVILYNFDSRLKHQFIHLGPHLPQWPSGQNGPKPCHGPYFPPLPFLVQLCFWHYSFCIVLSLCKRSVGPSLAQNARGDQKLWHHEHKTSKWPNMLQSAWPIVLPTKPGHNLNFTRPQLSPKISS